MTTPSMQRLAAFRSGRLAAFALCSCKAGEYGAARGDSCDPTVVAMLQKVGLDPYSECPFCKGKRIVCSVCLNLGVIDDGHDDVDCPVCHGDPSAHGRHLGRRDRVLAKRRLAEGREG